MATMGHPCGGGGGGVWPRAARPVPGNGRERTGGRAVDGWQGAGGAGPVKEAGGTRSRQARGWSWDDLPGDGAARQAAITRQMEQVLGLTSPSERQAAVAAFFQYYLPEDYEAVMAPFNAHHQQGQLFSREYQWFIQHCVSVEGGPAMDRMFQNEDRVNFLPAGWQLEAMAEWSGKQGPAAVAWWNQLPEGLLRESLAHPLIEGLARQDTPAAWNYVQLFPAGERVEFAGIMVQQHLTNGGIAAASAWIKSLEDMPATGIPGVQAHAAGTLLQSMSHIPAPQRAEAMLPFVRESWFASYAVGQRLTGEWARQDPAAAGAWIKTNIPESVRLPMLEKIAARFREAAPGQSRQFEAALAAQ